MDYKDRIRTYVDLEIETLKKLDLEELNLALKALKKAFEEEKNIFIFGNGGSSATASHFQNDFNKGISEFTEKKFRFLCLNDNIATVMAIANDIGFEEVFRFQLKGRINPGDLVIAISGSGNSPNVINAVEYAKSQGNTVIGLTGFSGGKLKELAELKLHVPVNSMQVTEDIHMFFDHLMMSIFYETLAGKNHLKN